MLNNSMQQFSYVEESTPRRGKTIFRTCSTDIGFKPNNDMLIYSVSGHDYFTTRY